MGLASDRVTVTGFESGSIIAVTEIEADDAAKDMKKLENAVKGGTIVVPDYPVNKDVPVTSDNAGEIRRTSAAVGQKYHNCLH